MGCGVSLSQLITQPGGRTLSFPDVLQIARLLDTGYPINKPLVDGSDSTVLALAARHHQYAIVEKILDSYGDAISQENLNAALMASMSTIKAPLNLETVVLLLHHGACLTSALRLSRVLRAAGLHDFDDMKKVVFALVSSSKHESVEGALLNALCNAGIQMRVRLSVDIMSLQQEESLLIDIFCAGVRPESFWSNTLQDLCLQRDDPRFFKPSTVTITFIRACHRTESLHRVLESSTIFTKPCDLVLEYLTLLGQAGYFSDPRQRLTPQQLRNLIALNPLHANDEGDPEIFAEYLGCIFKQTRTLVNLSVLQLRRNIGERNVFHGVQQLTKVIQIPKKIENLLLLKS